MATPDWAKRVVALIKWGKREHLEKLVRGELYLNTPEYYRINADKSFGDKFESCAYSYRQQRDQIAPIFLKDGVPLSHFHPTSATLYSATDRSFYLHCWSMVSAWDDSCGLEAMVADLQKQREQLGPCFVALRSGNIGKLLERIQRREPNAGCSHVEYSDNPNQQSCVCKRTQFSWQREFRFLAGECAEKHTDARRLWVGDLSDLLLFNGTLDLRNGKSHVVIDPDCSRVTQTAFWPLHPAG